MMVKLKLLLSTLVVSKVIIKKSESSDKFSYSLFLHIKILLVYKDFLPFSSRYNDNSVLNLNELY